MLVNYWRKVAEHDPNAKDSDLRPVGSFTAQENANMAHFKSVQAHNLERIKKGLQPKSFHTYETPKVPAKDSARRARLHRALDAVMDAK